MTGKHRGILLAGLLILAMAVIGFMQPVFASTVSPVPIAVLDLDYIENS